MGTQGGHQASGLTEGTHKRAGATSLCSSPPLPLAFLGVLEMGVPHTPGQLPQLQASCGPGPLEQQLVQDPHDPPGGLWTAFREQAWGLWLPWPSRLGQLRNTQAQTRVGGISAPAHKGWSRPLNPRIPHPTTRQGGRSTQQANLYVLFPQGRGCEPRAWPGRGSFLQRGCTPGSRVCPTNDWFSGRPSWVPGGRLQGAQAGAGRGAHLWVTGSRAGPSR